VLAANANFMHLAAVVGDSNAIMGFLYMRFVVAELVSKLNLSSQHEKQFDESFDHTQQQRLRLQGVIQQTERGVLWVVQQYSLSPDILSACEDPLLQEVTPHQIAVPQDHACQKEEEEPPPCPSPPTDIHIEPPHQQSNDVRQCALTLQHGLAAHLWTLKRGSQSYTSATPHAQVQGPASHQQAGVMASVVKEEKEPVTGIDIAPNSTVCDVSRIVQWHNHPFSSATSGARKEHHHSGVACSVSPPPEQVELQVEPKVAPGVESTRAVNPKPPIKYAFKEIAYEDNTGAQLIYNTFDPSTLHYGPKKRKH